MELSHIALDIVRCDLCDTPDPSLFCNLCHIYLCKACTGEHLLDASKKHHVVPFKDRRSRSTVNHPLCKKHSPKQCELYCEQCEDSICDHCVSSGNHESHNLKDYSSIMIKNKEDVHKDLMEFENDLYPKYLMMSRSILGMKAEQCENSKKITTALIKQGEIWHTEIDTVIKELKSKLEEMDSGNLAILKKREDEITFAIAKITQNIADLRNLLDSNNESLFFNYKSRNAKFRKLPSKLKICLPNFTPQKINTEQLNKQFGSLSALLITTEDHDNTMETSETGSFSLGPLLDEPQIITTIQTEYGGYIKGLRRVVCKNDEEIWTCGDNSSIMSLYNLKGELVKTIQTRSGNMPWDITVTKCGDLVYTDYNERTVDIVKNTQIQEVIKLHDWRPCSVCSTSSDDLLVFLKSDDLEQTKVVRYSGSIEIQSIQFNNNDTLYSSSDIKYITENKNRDICVADSTANAVVIVDHAGKFRLNYPDFSSTTKSLFEPIGITTDSQGRILTTDWHKKTEYGIYILDQDGKFLRYIDHPYFHCPWGVCVDTKDNLFMAEYYTGKVKKIKYCL